MLIDFDAWRRHYENSTYAEQVEFYRKAADLYPEQRYFNAEAALAFLRGIGETDVLELGGWKGELAALLLPQLPSIRSWFNVEIAPQTITESACHDPRYGVMVPSDYLWNLGLDLSRYETFIASHVLEHLKVADIVRLFQVLGSVRHLYVDAPLPPEGSAWEGGESSHIIEIGWTALKNLIESHGFRWAGSTPGHDGSIMWFER